QRAVLFHTCLHACGLFYNQREQRSVTRARSTNTQRHIKPIAPLPPSLFSSSVFACPRVGPVLLNMLGERDSVCVCVCVWVCVCVGVCVCVSSRARRVGRDV